MQLSELRERVRERSDMQSTQFISDSELTGYINSSYAELYDILVSRFEDYYTVEYPFSIANGSSAALPEDFYKLAGLDFSNSGDWVTVPKFNFAERNSIPYQSFGLARRYRLIQDNIVIKPDERGPGDYRMWYVPRFVPLVNDSDDMNNVLDFEEYVIVDAAIKCVVKEESDPQALMIAKQALLARVQSMSANRDEGEPETIADIRGNRLEGRFRGWFY